MREFNMGNLDQWEQVAPGDLIDFAVPEQGFRAVRFDVITDAHVSVRVITPDSWWLAATGIGKMSVRFGMDRNFAVSVEGDADTAIFVRTGREVQIIPESVNPTHTTVEPRGSQVSADLKRMMHMVRLNQRHREDMLKAEIARLAATRPPERAAEPVAAPPAAPEPDAAVE